MESRAHIIAMSLTFTTEKGYSTSTLPVRNEATRDNPAEGWQDPGWQDHDN